ncbi:uncharacterized protein LOC128728571 [Anopheles nili]|uniref:uncharacterized protein LOC128728571 n=1 Tax=Anopheles nili TaxID=185578 RepID=UPI00237B7029|nr:uncharacterized protein LOC128728571 [Anopheles nili]
MDSDATVYAVGAVDHDLEAKHEEVVGGGDEGGSGGDGGAACTREEPACEGSPEKPPPVGPESEHSHCDSTEPPEEEKGLEDAPGEGPQVFITAHATSGEAPVVVAIDEASETDNTLATIVSDHGVASIDGAQPQQHLQPQQQQQQQVVYVRSPTPVEGVTPTATSSTLVHCGTGPESNVVRIQIVPVECASASSATPSATPSPTSQLSALEDCNNNSLSGASPSAKCQSAQVTVVSFGGPCDSVQRPLAETHRTATERDPVLVTVTFEDRTVVSVPASAPPPLSESTANGCQNSPTVEEEANGGDMVQKKLIVPKGGVASGSTDLDGSAYVYYMAAMAMDGGTRPGSSASASASGGSSGQCSPSDMLDSGTCSDIELTPPPLPKKMSQMLKSAVAIKTNAHQPSASPAPADNAPDTVIARADHQHQQHHEFQRLQHRASGLEPHQTLVGLTSDSPDSARQQQPQQPQQQPPPPPTSGSAVGTDSDGSESCLSCDSLNFEHLPGLQRAVELNGATITGTAPTPNPPTGTGAGEQIRPKPPVYVAGKRNGAGVCTLPDSLLAAIRGSRPKVYCTDEEDADIEEEDTQHFRPVSSRDGSSASLELSNPTVTATTRSILMDKINSLESGNRTHHRASIDQPEPDPASNYYLQHLHHQPHTINDRAQSSCSAGSLTTDSVRSNQFESDRFYKFHINERARVDGVEPGSSSPETTPSVVDDDESFAGLKDLSNGTSTIRSNKGTVRGVKNRVRNGIATFLQMQQTGLKNYKDKEAGKVVVYSTSMGIVRETYTKCMNVKQILRTLLVKFEEKDIFMSNEYQQEIKERMQVDTINIPQVFVDGQHIGDAECIERLNESGELRKMLKPYKCLESPYMCKMCGGYRLLPCPSCGGSKKSIHRNHFTAEFIALKCMNCDEVGLVKCHSC